LDIWQDAGRVKKTRDSCAKTARNVSISPTVELEGQRNARVRNEQAQSNQWQIDRTPQIKISGEQKVRRPRGP
jgi:hypothetical protein